MNWAPSLVYNDLARKFNEKVREDRRFTMSALSSDFKDYITLSVAIWVAGGRIL